MKRQIYTLILSLLSFNLYSQVTRMHGLAVIVDFNDVTQPVSNETVDSMLNQRNGYNRSNNAGSLYEFYKDQTNNRVEITHKVVRVRFDKNQSYFSNSGGLHPDTRQPWDYGKAFADSVLMRVKKLYPNGIPGLTTHSGTNNIHSYLIIQRFNTSAYGTNNVITLGSDNRDIRVHHVALANMGEGTEENHRIRLIAHETGHSIFNLPDVGNQKGDNLLRVNGHAGSYCMMGWNAGSPASAVDFCAPLLESLDMLKVVDIELSGLDRIYSLKSNAKDTLFRYKNPNNPNEYFLFQALNHSKWFPRFNTANHPMHTGLSIWHVIHGISQRAKNPWMRIVQADGYDLMNRIGVSTQTATGTDNRVFFGSQVKAVNGHINPLFRWLDGTIPGLYIENISNPGERMTFLVKGSGRVLTSRISSGFGVVDPLGFSLLQNGENRTVNFVPDWGHEIENVFVNGVSQGAINSYNVDGLVNIVNVDVAFRFPHQKISPFAPGALWRVHSVSSVDGSNAATRSFDNNSATHWTSNEDNDYKHEIAINMGALYRLSGVALQLRNDYGNLVGQYEIHASVDGENWLLLRDASTFNFGNNNYRIVGFNSILARYIKVITKSSLVSTKRASISEIEAYGVRVTANSILTDSEISKSAWRIHGVSSQDMNRPAANLIDGNTNTAWHTQIAPLRRRYPHYIDIDFGSSYNISRFRVLPNSASADARIAKFALFVSNDGVNWGDTLATATWLNTNEEKVVYFVPTNARFLRIQGLSEAANNLSASASEIYVHGSVATSVDNLLQNDNLKVFAISQHIFVESDNTISNVDVFDSMGRIMYSNKNFRNKKRIDKSFQSGMYIVRTIVNNDKIYKKVLVN